MKNLSDDDTKCPICLNVARHDGGACGFFYGCTTIHGYNTDNMTFCEGYYEFHSLNRGDALSSDFNGVSFLNESIHNNRRLKNERKTN